MLAEVRGFTMLQFAYMLLRAYDEGEVHLSEYDMTDNYSFNSLVLNLIL